MPRNTRKRRTAGTRGGAKAFGKTPTASQIDRAAIRHGRAQAKAILGARKKTAGAKGPKGLNGLLIAEGDSWFDYPFFDTLERLEGKFSFEVESVAHKGDTLEQIAYDPTQGTALARMFEKLGDDGKVPRAILLSGGGNDIAGTEFAMLLNHATSGLQDVNESVVKGVIDERLRFAVISVLSGVTQLSLAHFGKKVPVVIHGYGYAVPDGRGYKGGFWILPGPWLEPGFRQKGYVAPPQLEVDLPRCTEIMERLMDRFNAMIAAVAALPTFSSHVTYLDLRKVLSNALPSGYRSSWGDELHPTKAGFEEVAKRFRDVILNFPKP